MATGTLYEYIEDALGNPIPNVIVTARLRPGAGWRSSDYAQIAGSVTTRTDATGYFSLVLERNADILPANTFYEVTLEFPDRRTRQYKVQVGAGATSLYASQVTPPPPNADTYLTRAVADALYLGVGSAGTYDGGGAVGAGALATANTWQLHQAFKGGPWVDVKAWGAIGDGVADDTAAIQAAITAIGVTGGSLFFSNGEYKVNGALSIATSTIHLNIVFAGNAWLAPTSGWALKLNGNGRINVYAPKVRLNAGSTATRGLWIYDSTRVTIYDPQVWSYINVPAGFVGIDVDHNSYWVRVYNPHIRKDSGGLTGTFACGVRFFDQSNAGSVTGGDISHCDDGVQVDGSNAVLVMGAAFEDCTDAIDLKTPTASGANYGFMATANRAESCTNFLNISDTSDPAPVYQEWGNSIHGSTVHVAGQTSKDHYLRVGGGLRVTGSAKSITLANGGMGLRDGTGGALHVESANTILIDGDSDSSGAGNVRVRVSGTERMRADTTGLGFFGVAPVARPTVTGSRGGNAALTSALTALASLGLIINSSSA